jgi:hypothetical protein
VRWLSPDRPLHRVAESRARSLHDHVMGQKLGRLDETLHRYLTLGQRGALAPEIKIQDRTYGPMPVGDGEIIPPIITITSQVDATHGQ